MSCNSQVLSSFWNYNETNKIYKKYTTVYFDKTENINSSLYTTVFSYYVRIFNMSFIKATNTIFVLTKILEKYVDENADFEKSEFKVENWG